ncbi:methyl-accepting chemotaxis protein [Rhizobium sp. AAP43]|uniref:methyl-accepting chemotaxis protein n=1 Tax=Rhizobium sp. AAP43 TaxID=1523420 RepID=UPI0006B9EE53|nr:methyl-accepting chemotaxis protein [Rhizobium sp. AAP43]KPF42463.1 chemotaxis protein [Rhizobium sp. AAP43]
MPQIKSGHGMSVKQRILTLAAAAILGIGTMLGIGWYQNTKLDSALNHSIEIQNEVERINEMRLANANMVLAAMDSIIDRGEGKIQPDRVTIIDGALTLLRDNLPSLKAIAAETNASALLDNYDADIAELRKAVQVDLPRLIETGAPETEFGAIDDAIDGAGERVSNALNQLSKEGGNLVEQNVAEATSRSSQSLIFQLVTGAIAFLTVMLLQLLHGNSIVNGIRAVRSSMQRIVDGDYQTDVDGSERQDEIGDMARSAEIFRQAAIEKQSLESRTSAERLLTEQQRESRAAALDADTRALRAAVDALATGLMRLSDGDLTTEIVTPFPTDLERLRHDFNAVSIKLRAVMQEITVNSSSIRANSLQMRAAADDLAKRTEQQASSLEESSAALAQLTATVHSAAERAEEASRLVAQAKDRAEESGAVVNDATSAMGRIQDASSEIGKIINVIDEIAFQTNLLALNAGVEAARAGEAGKGFAVVAQEVRALAGRATDAARDIKALVNRSTLEVRSGVELVTAAGQALSGIGEEVLRINDLVKAIVTSAREQSTGLSEINSAVGQMDQVTQQNAAMVEQTNAASHTLASDAEGLTRLVGQFKMNGTDPAHAERAQPARADVRPEAPRPRAAIGAVPRYNRSAMASANHAPAQEHWEEF